MRVLITTSLLVLIAAAQAWAADSDNDGINDANDRCPERAEVYNEKDDRDGCPDTIAIQIKGMLTAAETTKQLAGKITIVSANRSAQVDAQGAFEWSVPEPGLYTVLAEVPGYASQVHTLMISTGQAVVLELRFQR